MKMAEVRRMDQIVVVGGGLAASRSCAALRRQGHDGDIVLIAAEPHMPYDRPPLSKGMLHGTCTEVAERFMPWWEGVDLRCGTAVARVERAGVLLGDGTLVPADTVITGIGVRPETGWLEGSGLQLDRGVVVDERLHAAPGIVAVGDVAARWSPRWDRRLRITHWDDGSSGPAIAAASLLAEADTGPVYDPVPYFWSDQFGHKVQYLGQLGTEDKPEFCEPADGRGWSVAWFGAERRLTAVLAVDRPRDIAQARRLLASDSPRLVAT